MRTKLTPAFCQRATVQQGAERTIYWDTDLPGFGLLVTKNGHRSFVVQYRSGETRSSRRMKIAGVLGLVGARKQARKLLGQVASDKDPLHERREQQRGDALHGGPTQTARIADHASSSLRLLNTRRDRNTIQSSVHDSGSVSVRTPALS